MNSTYEFTLMDGPKVKIIFFGGQKVEKKFRRTKTKS